MIKDTNSPSKYKRIAVYISVIIGYLAAVVDKRITYSTSASSKNNFKTMW